MINNLKVFAGLSKTRPIFVIGTGRSGTHWLGYSLGDHPEVRATIEAQPMFHLSRRMALNPDLESIFLGGLIAAYRWQLLKSSSRLYLDKSHPNIWIAEKLKKFFPKALFVGIERNPYATVASMMKHDGVAAWHRRWREFPIPNRFLGITPELINFYDKIPFAAQCSMRWVAHHKRIQELLNVLGDDLLVISYESFAHNTEQTIHELQQFLGLQQPIPIPDVKTESLDKWKTQLSDKEVRQIEKVVGFAPD
ncbi:MAG: sulfotransferase [Leptolyngbya sp. SIO1D8]|nr:sulfotransferase [Leptolyngbya sp. SIO1D8]